jgi:UrcA family protein
VLGPDAGVGFFFSVTFSSIERLYALSIHVTNRRNEMTRALVFTALLIGCLAGAAHATTTAARNVPHEVVSYADLNIANEADAAILLQRVKAAARRVCIRSGALLALDSHNPVQRCADDATGRAMADVNARTVTVASARL